VRARGLRVYDELLLINLWIDGTKPKSFRVSAQKRNVFSKKKTLNLHEKKKKKNRSVLQALWDGRERTTE